MPSSVTIGGRELQVLPRSAPGGLGRLKRTIAAEIALREAKPGETPDRVADVILCYVGHNEGVTHDWLLENLPAECGEIQRACIIASGGTVADAGEGKSQQS